MDFPTKSLLVLLKFVRNQGELTQDVFDAALEVLQYGYHIFVNHVWGDEPSKMSIEEALESAIDENTEKAKSFTPSVWITIAAFIVEQIIKKVIK